MWRGLGGSVGHFGSISWVRLFDWGAAGEQALERFEMAPWRPVVRPVLSAVRAVANRIPAISLRVKNPSTRAEDLTPQALLEHLPSILQHRLLHPSYDERFLARLFREMAAVRSRGELVKRLIRDRDQVLGWYVAYLQRRGLSQVMQIAARDRDVAAVLDHLFHDAQRGRGRAHRPVGSLPLGGALAAFATLLPPPQRQLPAVLPRPRGDQPDPAGPGHDHEDGWRTVDGTSPGAVRLSWGVRAPAKCRYGR
jgi:hypothetical protein